MTPEEAFHAKVGSRRDGESEREKVRFTPSPATREAFKQFSHDLSDQAQLRFFEIWENEIENSDAPRRAGSVLAGSYINAAAWLGIFGARCADIEPSRELWMQLAGEAFDHALVQVDEAITTVGVRDV